MHVEDIIVATTVAMPVVDGPQLELQLHPLGDMPAGDLDWSLVSTATRARSRRRVPLRMIGDTINALL